MDALKLLILTLFAIILASCSFQKGSTGANDEDLLNTEAEVLEEYGKVSLPEGMSTVGMARLLKDAGEVEYISCKDSDGGEDFLTPGKITAAFSIENETITRDYEDECKFDKVVERFCKGKRFVFKTYQCKSGCQYSACKK